jgi:hypothetical protein
MFHTFIFDIFIKKILSKNVPGSFIHTLSIKCFIFFSRPLYNDNEQLYSLIVWSEVALFSPWAKKNIANSSFW